MRQNSDRYRGERNNFKPQNRRSNRGVNHSSIAPANTRSTLPSGLSSATTSTQITPQLLHSQTVGERGPILLQDTQLHETLASFVHSTRLPRALYAKGYGAFGHFETINSMSEFTQAGFLQEAGCQVPVSVRFSLAFGSLGTTDTARNIRGFSTKFYTPEGNFDLLCNNIPVFFVRDAIRATDVLKRLMPSPVNNLADPERFWSVFADYPEAMHILTWLFSDSGTVKSFRQIRGYSVNTFVWRNAQGERRYVKYHWIPMAGEQTITSQEALRLAGENPDIAGLDLHDTIAQGTPVEFQLHVQLMDPSDETALTYDPLDATKIWDEEAYPLTSVGRLVLFSNPMNYLEQVEKLAFNPGNLLPGIELSDDRLLQGAASIYSDAQRYRLGPDFANITINRTRDCTLEATASSGDERQISGEIMRTDISRGDNFAQACERYCSLSTAQQNALIENIVSSLSNAAGRTQQQILYHLEQVSAEFAARVREQLNICRR